MLELTARPSIALIIQEVFADWSSSITARHGGGSRRGPASQMIWQFPSSHVILFFLVAHMQILARASITCAILEVAADHWLIFGLRAHTLRMSELTFIATAANASLIIPADLLVFACVRIRVAARVDVCALIHVCVRVFIHHASQKCSNGLRQQQSVQQFKLFARNGALKFDGSSQHLSKRLQVAAIKSAQ